MGLSEESPRSECRTRVLVTRYDALTIKRLMALMAQAGIVAIARLDNACFQPVMVGCKPTA
jgi:hypothetical protein